jgi:hypothetical protein
MPATEEGDVKGEVEGKKEWADAERRSECPEDAYASSMIRIGYQARMYASGYGK